IASRGPDLRLDLLPFVVQDVAEDDAGALPDEHARFRRALPPGAPADQRYLAVESPHDALLLWSRTYVCRASTSTRMDPLPPGPAFPPSMAMGAGASSWWARVRPAATGAPRTRWSSGSRRSVEQKSTNSTMKSSAKDSTWAWVVTS